MRGQTDPTTDAAGTTNADGTTDPDGTTATGGETTATATQATSPGSTTGG